MRTLRLVPVAVVLGAMTVAGPAQAAPVRYVIESDADETGLLSKVLLPALTAAAVSFEGGAGGFTIPSTGSQSLNDLSIDDVPIAAARYSGPGTPLPNPAIPLFRDDFVLVGPPSDPAEIASRAPHDMVAAFDRLGLVGDDGTARLVSRNDGSNTAEREARIWSLTTNTVKSPTPSAMPGEPLSEPGPGVSPWWQIKVNSSSAEQLKSATACQASQAYTAYFPAGNCYAFLSRAAFEHARAAGLAGNLTIVSDRNAATAPGGAGLLDDTYVARVVDPGFYPADAFYDPPDPVAAKRFVDVLRSDAVQRAISSYPTAAAPYFRGVTAAAAAPQSEATTSPRAGAPAPASPPATAASTSAQAAGFRVAKVSLSGTRVRFSISGAATVRVVVARRTTRRSHGKTTTRYATVQRVTVRARSAGKASIRLHRLHAGTYRITLTTTDAAGHRVAQHATRRVR